MNEFIEDLINDCAGHITPLDTVMKVAATDLIYLIVPLGFLLWFLPGAQAQRALRQRFCLGVVTSVLAGLLLAALVAHLYSDNRPFVSRADTTLLISHAADNGFPSEHTTISFAVAGTLIWWRRWVGLVTIFLASLVGFARVFVGVHWPSDVAAGAAIGIVTGALAAHTISWWIPLQARAARFLPDWLVVKP